MTNLEQQPSRTAADQWPLGVAVGVLAGLVGLLPWLLTGATLPLQNLWAGDTAPDDMPVALLPISQYSLTTILALLLFGAVLAGLIARSRPHWKWPILGGVALVQVVAAVESLIVTRQGLRSSGADSRVSIYFAGMALVVVLSLALALVGYLLVSRPSPAIVAIGIGFAAVPLTGWLVQWARVIFGDTGIPLWCLEAVRWAPAVLVGVALGFCGFIPIARIGVWVLDLFLLWFIPTAVTAFTAATGSRVFDADIAEMGAYGAEVFRAALFEVAPWPVVGAIVIGCVVAFGRTAVSRNETQAI